MLRTTSQNCPRDYDMDAQHEQDESKEFLRQHLEAFAERNYWLQHGLGAENHWLFVQAYDAWKLELYLPACTGFLTGIEASIRNTMSQVKNPAPVENIDDISTLSNSLLRQARAVGMVIDDLAFPGEQNFEVNLLTRSTHVELVKVRHTLCHGNILQYLRTQGDMGSFFTPECCLGLANNLHMVSRNWVASLGAFRKKTLGLR